jgi:hypothetical protein
MLHKSFPGSSYLNFGTTLCYVRLYSFYSSHGLIFFPQIRQRSWTVEELGFGAVLRGIGPKDIVP